jgi:NADP-reducing hydrogenase subunit HndB
MAKTMSLRDGDARAKVTVHMGTCGIAAGARKIMSTFLALVEERQEKDVILTTSGCAGLCVHEPMITVELKGEAPVKYIDLTEEKAKRIFADHVLGGKIVTDYALAIGSERVS